MLKVTPKRMNIKHKFDTEMKLALIISFFSFLLSLVVINDKAAVGYELSIFDSFSYIFYLFLFIPITSAGIYFWYININEENMFNSRFRFLWLLLIVLIMMFIFLLPYIKGYAFYPMGDMPTHLGNVFDIINTGEISTTLIYPIEHIYIATINLITDISVYNISTIIKILFIFIYALSLLLLSNYFFKKESLSILVAIIGTIQLAKVQQTPHEIAGLLLVMVFYIYFKSKTCDHKKANFIILFLLFFVLYPFFHPLLCIVLISSIIIFDLAINVLNYFFINRSKLNINDMHYLNQFSKIPIIGTIVLLTWFWNHYWFWNYQVGTVVRWLVYDNFDSNIGRVGDVMNRFTLYDINPIELAIKYYGINIVVILFSLMCLTKLYNSVFLKKNRFRSEINKNFFVLSSFIVLMMCFGFLTAIMPTWGGPERMLMYASLISPIYFCAYLFKTNSKYGRSISLILVLFIFILGPFNVHQSNFQDLPNLQVTQAEINGMNWVITFKEQTITSLFNHERPFRISSLILGAKKSKDVGIRSSDYKLEPHFGLDTYSNLGKAYTEDKYLLLSEYDEVLYLTLYPNSILYNIHDFIKIENDFTVSNVYENNGFRVYLVKTQL